MRIYTKRGDDGSTGLLYGGRVSKDDLRVEAYGATDESVAALGIARAASVDDELRALIVQLQRELFVVGAELATAPENASKLTDGQTRVTAPMVSALESAIDGWETRVRMPSEFVIPGESPASAAMDLARSFVRRAERRAVAVTMPDGSQVVPYLNRLADLLFVLARYEEGTFRPLKERG